MDSPPPSEAPGGRRGKEVGDKKFDGRKEFGEERLNWMGSMLGRKNLIG